VFRYRRSNREVGFSGEIALKIKMDGEKYLVHEDCNTILHNFTEAFIRQQFVSRKIGELDRALYAVNPS
jgi:hypothetical protein